MYNSIFRLRDMLDKEHIPYEFLDRSYDVLNYHHTHYQIVVNKPKSTERLISVVEGNYTYGGEGDLLEIMGCLTKEEYKQDSVVGWLSAEEVFKRIKKNYKKLLKEVDR